MKLKLACGGFLASLILLGGTSCGGDDEDNGGSTESLASTTTASADGTVKVSQNEKFGAILTTSDGLTLYLFAQDSDGKSSCNDACASTWPPLTTTAAPVEVVDGASGKFSLITRADGSKQWAVDGMALYLYAADNAAGDTKGDGIGGVWSVAKATGDHGSTAGATVVDQYGY